jgi:hypothetical protein
MKKYSIILPFIFGIGCFIAYTFIGSYVDQDGLLQEPFFLIPIGFLFIFFGIIFAGIKLIYKKLFIKRFDQEE